MELMETDDPIKSGLLKKTSQYREDLEDEAKEMSERTEKIVTNALVIGGSLLLTYFAYKQFSGGSKKKRKSKGNKIKVVGAAPVETEEDEEVEETTGPSKIITQIGTALVSQASVFLLSMAKEKLSEYLQSQQKKKTNGHS
jgi:arginine exporter protein ArgO